MIWHDLFLILSYFKICFPWNVCFRDILFPSVMIVFSGQLNKPNFFPAVVAYILKFW